MRFRYSARIYHGKENGVVLPTRWGQRVPPFKAGSASPKAMPKQSSEVQNLSRKRKLRRAAG